MNIKVKSLKREKRIANKKDRLCISITGVTMEIDGFFQKNINKWMAYQKEKKDPVLETENGEYVTKRAIILLV